MPQVGCYLVFIRMPFPGQRQEEIGEGGIIQASHRVRRLKVTTLSGGRSAPSPSVNQEEKFGRLPCEFC